MGGMIIYPLPPEAPEGTMKDVVLKGMEKATYLKFKNAAGLEFQRFMCEVERDGQSFTYCLYMYLDQRQTNHPNLEELRKNFGCYKFDFLLPHSSKDAMFRQIESMLDTFTPRVIAPEDLDPKRQR
jgi:hypothetical protein